MGTDAVSPLGRAGEAAQQLHAISAGGASKLKWETVPVPIFLLCRFNNQGRSFDFSLHSVESACMGAFFADSWSRSVVMRHKITMFTK